MTTTAGIVDDVITIFMLLLAVVEELGLTISVADGLES